MTRKDRASGPGDRVCVATEFSWSLSPTYCGRQNTGTRYMAARTSCHTDSGPPSPLFAQVFILKGVKVLCFDTLLQVLILKVVSREANGPFSVWKKTREPALCRAPKSTGPNSEKGSRVRAY